MREGDCPYYHTARWRRARRVFLAAHPLCVLCEAAGRDTPATVADHIKPHHGDYDLFWSQDNWQAVCPTCHSGTKRIEEKHGYSQAAGADGNPLDPRHPWVVSKN